MAIDIKNLIEFVQRDIANIDSTGDTQRILDLARFVDRQAKTTLLMYDSTSDLPNLLDDTADTAQLAYVANQKRLFVNQGTWKPMTQFGPPPPPIFQGTNFGYTSGGTLGPGTNTNVIDKFSFSADANATDVGDLTLARRQVTGQSSEDNGYTSGGSSPYLTTIDKFPFSADANATDVGDLTVGRYGASGQSSAANGNGYTSGGRASPGYSNVIDKFPFASDTNATDVGDLTKNKLYSSGQSSTISGYTTGGRDPADPVSPYNIIDKFPFSSDANATDVGDLTIAFLYGAGQSSSNNGYTSGGTPASNVIQKFSFSSEGNATDVGDLTVGRYGVVGQSSTVSGYTSGGLPPFPTTGIIDKFPFASDANATDVGDLTSGQNGGPAGQQY